MFGLKLAVKLKELIKPSQYSYFFKLQVYTKHGDYWICENKPSFVVTK